MATARQRVTNPEPFEEQEPFLYDTHRYYTYASGVGSGKTAVGLMRAATNVDHWNPGYMGAIVAPTSTMIKNAIFPLMREFGIRDKWEYKSPQSEEPGFHTPNGSRVLILSADNERTIERLAGLNLAWFWVDEARDVPERALQILIQRLRKGNYKNGFLTSTPRKNHLEDFAFKDVDRNDYWRQGEAYVYESADRLTITGVTPDANPYVNQEDITAIRDAHPDGLMQQEVEGQFIEVGGGIFKREMFEWTSPDSIKPHQEAVIGVDPAATADSQAAQDRDSDYWGVTVGYPRPSQGEIYIADTIQRRGMTLKEGCNFIQAVASECDSPKLVIEANQSQRWLQQELADRGLNAVPVQTTRNKEDKIIDLSIPISSGKVKFVRWDENRFAELHQQMLAWPESNHDDMIDSLSLVVNHSDVNTSERMFGGSYGESDLW